MLSLKLAWKHLLASPARTILTLIAMIAAASVVSWMVAGYDSMLSEFDDDAGKVMGRFDLQLLSSRHERGLNQSLLDEMTSDREYPATINLFKNTNVTVRKSGPSQLPVKIGQEPGEAPEMNSDNPSDVPVRGRQIDGQPTERQVTETRPAGPPGGGRNSPGSGRGRMGAGEATPALFGLPYRDPLLVGTDSVLAPLEMKEGKWLSQHQDGSDLVFSGVASEIAAKSLNVQVGDIVNIGSSAGVFRVRIVGIIEENPSGQKYSNIAGAGEMRYPGSNLIYVSIPDAERIAGGALPVSYASIKLDDSGQLPGFYDKWSGKASESKALLAAMPEIRAALSKQLDNSRLRMQALSATGISMLLSFFIIFTTLSMGVDERIRQFALLRTVGVKRTQVAAVILYESLFFGVAGWLGGLFSGYLLLEIMKHVDPSVLGNKTSIGIWTILLTGACALLGAVFAAILPMWRIMRIRPLDAMSPLGGQKKQTIRKWPIVIGLLLLAVNPLIVFIPGISEGSRVTLYGIIGCPAMTIAFVLLAPLITDVVMKLFTPLAAGILLFRPAFLKAQLSANLWRCIGTVISLSIGLGFYTAILIWSASMLIPFIPGKWMPDLFVAVIPGGLNHETAEKVAYLPGVEHERCLPVAVEQVKLAEDLTNSREHQNVVRQDNVVMMGVDVEKGYAGNRPLLPFDFVSGNKAEALEKLKSGGNYCLIPQHFSETANLKAGDSFELIPPDAPDTRATYTVAGVIDFKGWHWFSKYSATRRNAARTAAMVFSSYESVARTFNLQRVNFFWMDLLPGAEISAIESGIRKLAESNQGEEYHIAGLGDSKVTREYVRLTSKANLESSIAGRTEGIVDGMLKMPLLILLITSLAVANTAISSVRARKWEIGVMRSTGLSGFALTRLIIGEALIIGIAASVLSLSFGVFAGLCSAQMSTHLSFFGGMGWNFAIPYAKVAIGFGITLAICLAAALIPAISAGAQRPLSLLQDAAE